ncbi:MAG: hypothetical protein U1A78_30555 [Polyangia bacterium]
MWAVAYSGAILKWDGTAWALQDSGANDDLNVLWGVGTNNVWAAGRSGTILHKPQ